MRKLLKGLVLIFLIWRGILLLVSLLADGFLKYAPSFPYADSLLATLSLPRFLYSWANFDGVHYITIAKEGYTHVRFIQAFFPLLPMILKPIFMIFGAYALFFSLFLIGCFALLATMTWFLFMRHFFGDKTARLSLIILLLFPTSLFLGALYTEGVFLILVLGTFLASSQKRWGLATLLVLLASATRIVGIFLVPALLLELYLTTKNSKFPWKTALLISTGSLGLIAYMIYLKLAVNDPLAFFHAQAGFGAGRQTNLVIYPQVVFRSLKILLTNSFNLKYLAYLQEFLAGTLGLIGIILGAKYSRPSWMLFALCAFFLPTLTGTFSSMSRYLLVCFPLFIFLTKYLETRPITRLIWIIVSGFLLVLNTLLFIQGYWVA